MNLKPTFIEFITSNGPYRYFLTVTFKKVQRPDVCVQQMNFIISHLNKKIFARTDEPDHILGFVFAEKQQNRDRNPLHFHMALKDHVLFHVTGKKTLEEHFYDAVKKVGSQELIKNGKMIKTMNQTCCDFQEIYEENGLFKYLTKTYKRPVEFDYLQPLMQDGISNF